MISYKLWQIHRLHPFSVPHCMCVISFLFFLAQLIGTSVVELHAREDIPGMKHVYMLRIHAKTPLRAGIRCHV